MAAVAIGPRSEAANGGFNPQRTQRNPAAPTQYLAHLAAARWATVTNRPAYAIPSLSVKLGGAWPTACYLAKIHQFPQRELEGPG